MTMKNTLNKQQEVAAYYQGDAQNLLVMAGAGCGKTKTIISRAAFLVKSGVNASRILMLTFTNRAAREMKQRLRDRTCRAECRCRHISQFLPKGNE